jgi:hypothetical protein
MHMGNKPFTMLAVVIFAVIALLHIYRLVTHFQFVLGSHTIPMWCSIVGAIVAALLAFMVYRESKR